MVLLLQYKEETPILMSSHIAESIVRCSTAYSIEDGHLDAIESNLEDWFHDVNRQRG